MQHKKCLECGVEFCKKENNSKRYWESKKFCSVDCSNKNRKGKHFSPQSEFKKGRTISEEERQKHLGHTAWNKGISVRLSPKSEFKKGNSVNIGRVRLDVGRNSKCWVEPITVKCSHCSNPIELKPNQIKNRKRFFCNRECWALGTRGLGSPVFKGEKAVSIFRNRVSQLPEYQEWRRVILKRDNYKCTITGCTQTRKIPLEVDHIKRFLFIVIENNLETVEDARNCKELWDTSNGRVVCRVCHRTLDTYGTKGLAKLST